MNSQINELVKMRDRETLYELMTESEEWLMQFDAAEGLVKLGDRRGYEFLVQATLSDDPEIHEAANEILDSPEIAAMRREIEAERENEHRAHIESAKKRLQKGGKVYRYKMTYLSLNAIIDDDPLGRGFDIPALNEQGLDGWEVVNILPVRRSVLVGNMDDQFTAAYFLLKKEILPDESAQLESK